ncbi:MAG: thermonuclease family protein [Acidimicrobiales bacterium]|nr:thermonuclease family protein [Hyphomonadaceae bacterium]RZV44460.1 MAG: thermonuclease family protein [Acidimicrobiales bacterium]
MKQSIVKIVTIALLTGAPIGLWLGGFSAFGKTRAETSHSLLTQGETGQVSYVIDGDGFILESGVKVKLAGIEAPQMAWPEQNRDAFPLADEARDYLDQLIKNQTAGLYYGGETRDRYDRALAQVWLMDENGQKKTWLQEAIVRAGYARVYPWPDQALDIERLFEAEKEARKARRGIWNNRRTKSFYKIRKPDPNPLAQYVDSLQLVEGIIVSTADIKGTVYLNFGSDYKTDFTVGIGKKYVKTFSKAGLDPVGLEGARVRVRGWLELQNGPVIWIADPRRLEIIR